MVRCSLTVGLTAPEFIIKQVGFESIGSESSDQKDKSTLQERLAPNKITENAI